MKRPLTIALLGCALFGAGLAIAGVTKFSFINITFPDGTLGTIRAGSKITNTAQFSVCDYYAAPNDAYIGMYQSSTFATTDEVAMEDFCWSHYYERQ